MYINPILKSRNLGRMLEFSDTLSTPHIIIDPEMVKNEFRNLVSKFPRTKIFYAVKANPCPEILRLVARLGSNFDVASRYELDMLIGLGVEPERMFYGNTIKKAADIAYFYSKGVRTFASDCEDDLLKIARNAPGSKVYFRLLLEGAEATADWPLSRKFGCRAEVIQDLIVKAIDVGLDVFGLSFHVGSQQRDIEQWDLALRAVAEICKVSPVPIRLINMGGGLPAHYLHEAKPLSTYAAHINRYIEKYFPDPTTRPEIAMEPGRSLVADSGILVTEVVTVARKSVEAEIRWVYLDAGKFNGLIETLDESVKYVVKTEDEIKGTADPTEPRAEVILAGPTCDSMDVMYEDYKYTMPESLKSGERLYFLSTGAYTSSYASVAFNGFPPIQTYVLPQHFVARRLIK
ncbi:MAG: type III PLP-dependent enzyme [Spirochaetales bacterium]|nr:type III PLP-dependent enzyme [Spirochaetales bacterium]